MFTQIADIAAVRADLDTVRGNENATRKILNQRVPEIAQGVTAGDNVSIANRVIASVAGNRQREMFLFLKAHIPFEYDQDSMKFTKKSKDERYIKTREDNLRAFLESGQTVFGWLTLNTKVEPKEPDYIARVLKAVKGALKHDATQTDILRAVFEGGVELETIRNVFAELAAEEAAQEEAA